MTKEKLSQAKHDLLEKWLQGKQFANIEPGIPRRPQNVPINISLPQRRHLFLELLERGTAVNNLSVFIQLKGKPDFAALEKGANQILARHEVLRTRFSFNSGLPAADISNDFKIDIPIVDLQEFEENERETKARQLAEKEVLQPFDLSKAPLIRLKIYKLNEENYSLLLTIHHTIADGWSLGVFLRELMMFYQANTTGSLLQKAELPIQYYDYAHWQTDARQADTLQSSMSYWKKQLGGELPSLELPVDHPRGTRQTFTGATHRFVISKERTEALEKLSRQEDATLFMTLLTAFYILLHRYSRQDDILVGTPIANRNIAELENLIGVFINTIVLRVSFSDDPSFRNLLRQVRTTCLDAYAHQDLPFEKLLEEVKPKRNLNRPPLFQVIFNLQNSPMPKLQIEGLETAFLEIDRGVSQVELTLMISRLEGQCQATVEYNADLFEPATIARMFQSYQVFLEYTSTQPDSPVSKLQLVTQAELHRVVYELNQTQADFPREKCVHQLIEKQAEHTPYAIAIIYDQIQITYYELNRRANALARRLQELGVGPEIRVGILMTKSLEIVEVVLGVLKAGGAYIPIHIASPPERIQFILKDANAHLLLTNVDPGPLDEFMGLVVNLRDESVLSKSDLLNDQVPVNPDNLAYIIYTSGSTGQPKGVMMNHFSLVNFLWSMRDNPGMNKDTVTLALASISFDISTLELFLPLMVGGKVMMASEGMTTNPVLIGETINNYDVNLLQATPATWQLLLDSGWPGKPGLKALCGGDILTRKMADQLLERVGSLWNMYGPTETTVWCMFCQVKRDNNPISIGQPINNMQVYILDRYLQPLPVGVIGELYIAGEGLARAYLDNPELTSEKFIPNLFNSKAGDRLYKTGDLARYLPDYSMEILGRIDDQVKVQGHRIELGEITAVLMKHPSVNDGIVTTRAETSGEKRLVAYFVPKNSESVDKSEIREFLAKKLPPYMMPAFFVAMNSLPLTPNGKIDRRSLPAPEDILLSGYVSPRNEQEEILAKIWQSVLDIEQVGIHDNFFDLGGASIQSIQAVAQANMYGFRISAKDIFEHQTIAELALYLKVK